MEYSSSSDVFLGHDDLVTGCQPPVFLMLFLDVLWNIPKSSASTELSISLQETQGITSTEKVVFLAEDFCGPLGKCPSAQ